MFGLTLEKLFVAVVIAGLIVGPQRLPVYAARLGELVRGLRSFVQATQARAESELGVPLRTDHWQQQVRQYDPRKILREALADTPAERAARTAHETPASEPAAGEVATEQAAAVGHAPVVASATEPGERDETTATSTVAEPAAPAASANPSARGRWVVAGGSSGHPRRILVATAPTPAADPGAEKN